MSSRLPRAAPPYPTDLDLGPSAAGSTSAGAAGTTAPADAGPAGTATATGTVTGTGGDALGPVDHPLAARPLTPTPQLQFPSPSQSPTSASPSNPPSLPSLPSVAASHYSTATPASPPATSARQRHHHHPPPQYQGSNNPYHVGITPPSPLGRQFPSPRHGSPLPWPLDDHLYNHNHNHNRPQSDDGANADSPDDAAVAIAADEDDDDDDDPITYDSKDVLVQRLADLAQRVSLSPGRDVAILHGKVDEMERTLGSSSNGTPPRRRSSHHHNHRHHHHHHQHQQLLQQPQPQPQQPQLPDHLSDPHGDRFWQSSAVRTRSPSWLRARCSDVSPLARYSGESALASRRGSCLGATPGPAAAAAAAAAAAGGDDESVEGSRGGRRQMVPVEDMRRVVAEAERLNSDLQTLLVNLRARQEESDHIHGLLIERAERAAQRILFLQGRVNHLEHELQENDSELQHLRVQLKAIEIQCPPPDGMDVGLRESIENWKSDWAALRQKRALSVAATFYGGAEGDTDLTSLLLDGTGGGGGGAVSPSPSPSPVTSTSRKRRA